VPASAAVEAPPELLLAPSPLLPPPEPPPLELLPASSALQTAIPNSAPYEPLQQADCVSPLDR
jgi:hypothetical protein